MADSRSAVGAGAGVHQGSLGGPKHEVFLAPVPNHAMLDALLAALRDPFIPARVVAIGMATCSQFLWIPHPTGIALSHAIFKHQRGFAIGLRAVRRVAILCIRRKIKKLQTTNNSRSALWPTPAVRAMYRAMCLHDVSERCIARYFARWCTDNIVRYQTQY